MITSAITPSLATRTFTVPAGGSVEYMRSSDYLMCLAATAPFAVSLENNPQTEFESGLTYRPANGIHKVEIINLSSDQELVVKLAFGRGDIQDNRAAFSGSLEVREEMPDRLKTGPRVDVAGSGTTLVSAANDRRREVIVQNVSPVMLWLVSRPNPVAGEGIGLDREQTIILSTTAAIYVRNITPSVREVSVSELERSA